MGPVVRREYTGLTLRRMYRGIARLLTLAELAMFPTVGSEELLEPFRTLTRDRITRVVTATNIHGATSPLSAPTALNLWKLACLAAIHRAYAAALPTVALLAVVSFALCLSIGRARERGRPRPVPSFRSTCSRSIP